MSDTPWGRNDEAAVALNSLTRVESKLAALEASAMAEIGGLKRDYEALRTGNHELRHEMQMLIIEVTRGQSTLTTHLQQCEHRGALLTRLGFSILAIVVAVLGVLLKAHFNF